MLISTIVAAVLLADGPDADTSASFAAPIPVTQPAAAAISKLLYPTPVLHDTDDDGELEMVLGDLIGHLWVCEKLEGGIMDWSEPKAIESGGKPIKFDNW